MFPKKLSDYLAKIVKFFCKNRWIFQQKLLNFPEKSSNFPAKMLNFSAKIFELFYNDHKLFLELLTLRVRSEKQSSKWLGEKGPKIIILEKFGEILNKCEYQTSFEKSRRISLDFSISFGKSSRCEKSSGKC